VSIATVLVSGASPGEGTATVESVFCPNCGHRNPTGVNYCSSCGTALVTSVPDTSVSGTPVEDLVDGPEELSPLGLTELPRGVALLVIARGPDVGARFTLETGITRVGRHPENDIFLDDVTVSRRHAEFVLQDQVATVRDVGSTNGTFVNRERIEEMRLSSGDEVQIGKFRLVFMMAAPE
jgi:hypothetical protein